MPALNQAPSRYAILGRYLLHPEIFDILARTPTDTRGEIQLTDALRIYLAEGGEHIDGRGQSTPFESKANATTQGTSSAT